MIFGYGVAAGLVIGLFRGGQVRSLGDARLRLWGLCLGAFVLHRLLPLVLPPTRQGAFVQIMDAALFYGALAAFALANRRLPGAYWLLAGAAGNGAATLWAGGRMPVWTAVLGRISEHVVQVLLAGQNLTHVAMTRPVGLEWVGDIVPVPAPLPPDVISPGDICIAVGAAVFLARVMAPRRPARHSLPS